MGELSLGDMFLSIIIPVYNVEPYLERCLQTVLACDLADCEVLLSLGDSTDRSGEISLAYARRYANVRVLHQRTTGLSDARNTALDIAKGQYVLFLDSDDFVDSARLGELIVRLRGEDFAPDVVMTDFRRREAATGRYTDVFQIGADTPEMRGTEHLSKVLRNRACFWNVWRYVYRHAFLDDHGLRFREHCMGEDIGFTTAVLLSNPDIVFIHCPYYIYEQGRAESLMETPTIQRLEDTVWTLRDAISKTKTSDAVFAPYMASRYQLEYILNMALIPEVPSEDRPKARTLYADWREILGGSEDSAVRAAAAALRLLGLGAVSRLLHILKTARRLYRRR